MMNTVSAEKTDWSDKNYDFPSIWRVELKELKISSSAEMPNEVMEQVLQDEYEKIAKNKNYKNYKLVDEGADVYLDVEIMKWHDDEYIKPAYTTWETKEIEETKRHSDGSKSKKTRTIQVPVEHPARRVATSTIEVKFDVYDIKSGKKIMSRVDSRTRDDSERGQKNMFIRIAKSFFDDFSKKLKK